MNEVVQMPDRLVAQLTARERSALELVARGLSNEGIAESLAINLKTVEGVLRSVFIKLGLGAASPAENRRVKAALVFLDASHSSSDIGGRISRDLRDLMATAPFDALATMLEHRSPEGGEQSWALRATAAWFATIHEDFVRAGRLARRARDLAATTSELGTLVTTAMIATLDAFQGLAQIDDACLDDLVAVLLDRPDTTGELAHLCANVEIPNWFTYADRFSDAAALIDRFIDHERLDAQEQLWLLCCQIEVDLRRGRWGQAESSLVAVIELSRLNGFSTGYADVLGARLQAMRGDVVAARAHLGHSRAAGFDRGDQSTLWRADAAECLLALGHGQFRDAAVLAESLSACCARSGLRLGSVRWWDMDAIEALVRADRRDAAESLIESIAADVARTAGSSTEAMLRAGRGLLAGADGLDDLRMAVALFGEVGAPFERARALLLLAEAAADSNPTEARAAAMSALTVFDALRSLRWSASARALLDSISER